MQSLYFYNLSETMPSLGGYLAECVSCNKRSVLLQVQRHTAFLLLLLLYCVVLLNAKLYALSDDVACC